MIFCGITCFRHYACDKTQNSVNAMKGYLGNPDQTKNHENPRAHKNRKCVTCIHRSSPSTQRVASKRTGCVPQSFLIISLSTFGSQKEKSHGQSGKAERIFQQTPPREESLPLETPSLPAERQKYHRCVPGYLIHDHPFVVSFEHWSWYRSVVEHVQVCCCATVALFSLFV